MVLLLTGNKSAYEIPMHTLAEYMLSNALRLPKWADWAKG